MDFAGGFIGGESEEVVLQGLVVSGFNRDHAYSSKYFTSDSGLFQFTWVTSFTFTDSVCEDNIMFAGRKFYIIESKKAFFSLANFAVATLRNNTFRRSMHSFGFFSENESVLVIENCTFEGDFAVGRSYIELGIVGRINTRIEESLFQGVTSSFGAIVLMQVQGELRISRTQFIDIYVFIPAGGFWYSAPLAMLYLTNAANITLDHILARSVQIGGLRTVPLIENLLATGLLNNCQAVQEDYMQAMELPCAALFHIATWTDVQVSNVDLTESGLCNSAIQIIGALGANETLIVDQLNVNTSANYGILAGKLLSRSFTVSVQNSIFQGCRISAITVATYDMAAFDLELRNVRFVETGAGVQFFGTSLRIVQCYFQGMRGYSGAIEYKVDTISAKDGAFQAVLSIQKCMFVNNTGERANDVSLQATGFSIYLTLEISDSTFTTRESRRGAIVLESVIISTAFIRSCQFTGYQLVAGTAIVTTAHLQGVLTLQDVLFTEVISPSADIILITSPSPLTLRHVTLSHSLFSAGIKLPSSATLLTDHCHFHHNQGVVIWAQSGSLRDRASVFEVNRARGYPCYFQDQQASAVFEDTLFRANEAELLPGGCLYLRKPRSSALFRNCTFENNRAATWGGVMKVESSALLTVENCRFLNNSAKYAAVLYIANIRVPLKLLNSEFSGNTGQGTLQIFDSTEVYLTNVSMKRNEDGVVLIVSTLIAEHCEFTELQGSQGCLLLARLSSTVSLQHCQVTELQCQTMLEVVYQSSLLLTDSSFHHLNAAVSVINVVTGSAQIAMLTIHTSNATSAFISLQSASLRLTHSHFFALQGRVIFSQASPLLSLSSSTITNVTSESEEGWLHCSAASTVLLQGLQVQHVASKLRGTFTSALQLTIDNCLFAEMHGALQGALFIQANSLNLTNSVFIGNRGRSQMSEGGALALATLTARIQNCSFEDNKAYAGGAVMWSATSPELVGNHFHRNMAIYGFNIASYATHLLLLNESTVQLASGQVLKDRVQVGVLDIYNQLLTRNTSKGELQGTGLSGALSTTAHQGILPFTDFTVTNTPGQLTTLVVQMGTLTIQFKPMLRHCTRGEVLFNNTCFVCKEGTYSVELNRTSCVDCPSEGSCPGDGHVYPLAGSWRPSEVYLGVLACPAAFACIGSGNFTSQIGLCAERYEGNLCQSCAQGTGRKGQDECALCPIPQINHLIIALAVLGVVVVIAALTRSALKGAKKRASTTGILFKIFLNYAQMLVLVARFPLQWPAVLKDFYVFHEFSGNSGEQLMSLDCVMEDVFYSKAVGATVLPVLLLVVNGALWGLVGGLYLLTGHALHLRAKFVCSTIVSLFYFHPMITRIALSCFQCFTLSPGQQWLRMELSLPCWDQRHLAVTLGAALPAAILWSAGIPALALLILFRRRKHLKLPKVREMVGFLYVGYQGRFYYWEVVVIYRKMVLTALGVFMASESVRTQVLTLVLLLTAALLLHLKCSPFLTPVLNKAELLSLFSVLITAYSGLYFESGGLSFYAEAALVGCTYLANAVFLIYLLQSFLLICFRNAKSRFLRYKMKPLPLSSMRQNTKAVYIEALRKQALVFCILSD